MFGSQSSLINLSRLVLFSQVLLVYVLVDWVNKGLQRWPPCFLQIPNLLRFTLTCQAYVYISYVSRLVSAYIVTAFIIER